MAFNLKQTSERVIFFLSFHSKAISGFEHEDYKEEFCTSDTGYRKFVAKFGVSLSNKAIANSSYFSNKLFGSGGVLSKRSKQSPVGKHLFLPPPFCGCIYKVHEVRRGWFRKRRYRVCDAAVLLLSLEGEVNYLVNRLNGDVSV